MSAHTIHLHIDPDKVSLEALRQLRRWFERRQAHEGGFEAWLNAIDDAIKAKAAQHDQHQRN